MKSLIVFIGVRNRLIFIKRPGAHGFDHGGFWSVLETV